MTLYSLHFFIFFVFASIAMQFVPNVIWQNKIFLFFNFVFYIYWDYRFLILIIGVIIVCYLSGLLYEKKMNNHIITVAIVLCVSILCIFKYYNFFIESFASAFRLRNIFTLNIILPLGISFYIFQAISYLIDIKKNIIRVEHDLIKLAAYVSSFFQITSGPIVKAHDFLPQLDRIHRIKKSNVYKGVLLFLTGLTKKVVFADCIGIAVDAVYDSPLSYNCISILFAIVGYSVQIFCDFSGYSDMAIGIATIWDFDLGLNFNSPYIATDPSDFWKRWHISLSSWFRDYVYIPLGGNRKGMIRTYINLFITMVLSGLWHGANITFIIWGSIHGLGAIIHKCWRGICGEKCKSIIYDYTCIIANFLFVSFAWVFFRAKDIHEAYIILSGLTRTKGISFVSVYTIVYSVIIILFNIFAYYLNDGNVVKININLDKFSGKVFLSVWIFLIIALMYVGNSSFIYAQF